MGGWSPPARRTDCGSGACARAAGALLAGGARHRCGLQPRRADPGVRLRASVRLLEGGREPAGDVREPGCADPREPRLSPDGRQLAVGATEGGRASTTSRPVVSTGRSPGTAAAWARSPSTGTARSSPPSRAIARARSGRRGATSWRARAWGTAASSRWPSARTGGVWPPPPRAGRGAPARSRAPARHPVGPRPGTRGLAWSRRGSVLAVAGADGVLRIADPGTGRSSAASPPPESPAGSTSARTAPWSRSPGPSA